MEQLDEIIKELSHLYEAADKFRARIHAAQKELEGLSSSNHDQTPDKQVVWLIGHGNQWNNAETSHGVFSSLEEAKRIAEKMARELSGDPTTLVTWDFSENMIHGAWRGTFYHRYAEAEHYMWVAGHILNESPMRRTAYYIR